MGTATSAPVEVTIETTEIITRYYAVNPVMSGVELGGTKLIYDSISYYLYVPIEHRTSIINDAHFIECH